MKIWACCTLPARQAVEKAVGVEPVTSPPFEVGTTGFNPKQMEGYDVLYFRLHGWPQIPDVMFGEDDNGDLIQAITREHIAGLRLNGAVVILANCYGATSPFVEAFYKAGAGVVIAGKGANYAAANKIIGTDLLVKYIIQALKVGLSIKKAMILAKTRLVLTMFRRADRDALAFRIENRRTI